MPERDTQPAVTVEQKMDVIIAHLERIDKRDRLRMWGSFVHSLFALIPLLFFVWSAWYLYEYGDDLLKQMTQEAARSAAEASGESYEDVVKRIQEAFGQGQPSE